MSSSIYIVVIILISLILYQLVATIIDDYRYLPTGKLVDIGGYKLHLNSSGAGKITVICDAGLSGTSLGWSLIQTEVAKFARICSYDRAGYAWSDPSPLKRTSLNIAKELHTLLQKAQIPGPYILVGHSFGGANVLIFADLYPEETLGVILVDSVHEEMELQPHSKIQWFLSLIGYYRLTGPSQEIRRMLQPLPEKIRNAYVAQMNKTRYIETVNRELDCLQESLSQLNGKKYHDLPLIVITAGLHANSEEEKKWRSLQDKLLLKSNCSKQIIAEKSDHMINHYQPELIVDAIREMVLTQRK